MTDKSNTNIDLQAVWKQMAEKKFLNKEIQKQEIMDALKTESTSTVVELQKGLRQKLNFFVGITGVLAFVTIIMFIIDSDPYFYLAFTLLYVVGYLFTNNEYKKMVAEKEDHSSVLSHLKANKNAIKSALRIERVWGGVAMLFLVIYYLNSWALEGIDNPRYFAFKTTIILLIIIVLGIWAEWANYRKFGKRIKKLDENIIRLETLS